MLEFLILFESYLITARFSLIGRLGGREMEHLGHKNCSDLRLSGPSKKAIWRLSKRLGAKRGLRLLNVFLEMFRDVVRNWLARARSALGRF